MKLNTSATHLLENIAKGKNRVFAHFDKPYGWSQLSKRGLVVRTDESPGDRAALTERGVTVARSMGFL